MDQRHQEYIEYYRARMRKYEGSALYPRLAAAERALFEAISTASSLEEFAERVQRDQLNLACAIARVRDVASAEAAFYEEIDEPVRAAPHREILAKLDGATHATVEDVNAIVSEVHTRWNLEISRDEMLLPEFWGDWKILEDIECDERAAVPDQWHQERRESVARELAAGARHYAEHILPEARKFIPDYTPDYDALWATRHRRKIPLADDVVAERIEGHKRYRGIR